jgi:hypothetical protein
MPLDPTGKKQEPPTDQERVLTRLQMDKGEGSTIVINNMNGLAIGQHMNDLSIY